MSQVVGSHPDVFSYELNYHQDVHFAFLDLEKAYVRVDRDAVECFEIIWNWW